MRGRRWKERGEKGLQGAKVVGEESKEVRRGNEGTSMKERRLKGKIE